MANVSRRALLRAATAAPALAVLGACTITTSNGVTTVTLNVAEFTADAKVALAVVQTALGFSGVPAAIVTVVDEGISAIQSGLAALANYAGSSVSVSFDRSSVPDAIASLIADIRTVAGNVSAVAASQGSTLGADLASKIASISTDAANIASILSSMVSLAAGAALMTSPQAQIQAIKLRHGLA